MTDVQSVAAGAFHTLILKTDGSVWACGSNRNGELGSYYLGFGDDRIETTPQQVVPFKVPADEEPFP
jgi:alpha-tubulin suppressor-like RCC1 family protein